MESGSESLITPAIRSNPTAPLRSSRSFGTSYTFLSFKNGPSRMEAFRVMAATRSGEANRAAADAGESLVVSSVTAEEISSSAQSRVLESLKTLKKDKY